jgi:pimeloyl-ACP methyl ester carboxylesterase
MPPEEARARLHASLPVSERRLSLAGISTLLLEGGKGKPIVLLHGPGGYGAHWMGVIPRLVATHRVIAPDLPGHGASEVTSGKLDAERLLSWLDELISMTCSSAPVLVAQHVSGAIAARYAIAHPDRLSRLVLVDTFGLTHFAPAPDFGAALGRFLAEPNDQTHSDLWRYCAFDLGGLRQRMGELWEPFAVYNTDRARTASVQEALHVLLAAFGPEIPASDLARISVPTALIWGKHDLATSVTFAQAASARYRWPLRVIEDCADDPSMERPEDFVRVLLEILDAH